MPQICRKHHILSYRTVGVVDTGIGKMVVDAQHFQRHALSYSAIPDDGAFAKIHIGLPISCM